MLGTEDGITSAKSYPRSDMRRTQTPQAFHLKDICRIHRKAIEAGINDSTTSCTLMIEMGERVYFSQGSEKNINITTVYDIDIFRALSSVGKSQNIKNYPDENLKQ